jgi:hypothetical protein
MDVPSLVSPADGATFPYEELIHFEWNLADAETYITKLDLYIGRNATAPWERQSSMAVRSWDIRPGSVWTHLNESAEALGLFPHDSYYWMVAQEKDGRMSLLSSIRSLRVGPQRVREKFKLYVQPRFNLRRGEPFEASIRLQNISPQAVRLFFKTTDHYSIAVSRMRLLGADEVVIHSGHPGPPVQEFVDLPPGRVSEESHVWPAHYDSGAPLEPGQYVISVRCLAPDFPVEVRAGCTISS